MIKYPQKRKEGRVMTKTKTFIPRGVCSRKIDIEVEDDIIKSIKFTGGCGGNTQGVAALAVGYKVQDVIGRLRGIHCGPRPTSCPDQLAQALEQLIAE